MKLTFIKGTAVGSAVAVAMLTATSALAGTGVGAVFNLGKTNTVNATSGLTGRAAGPMLNITAKGTGPALGLHVRAGKAPMTVNSATQVKNLNASLLGGLDASNFVHGFGQARVFALTLTMNQSGTMLQIPGYGALKAVCVLGGGALAEYANNERFGVDVWNNEQLSGASPFIFTATADPTVNEVLIDGGTSSAFAGWDEGMLHYTTFDGLFFVQHVARFEIGISFDGANTCRFIAEAYVGGGQIAP